MLPFYVIYFLLITLDVVPFAIFTVIVMGEVVVVGVISFDKLANEYEGVITLTVPAACCYYSNYY